MEAKANVVLCPCVDGKYCAMHSTEQAKKAYKAGIKEVVDNMELACVNGNTEWQKLTNLRDVMRYYEAKLKEWG